MDRQWTCPHCGKPISIYEPAVVAEARKGRITGRLIEHDSATPDGQRYHAACWHGQASAETPLFRV